MTLAFDRFREKSSAADDIRESNNPGPRSLSEMLFPRGVTLTVTRSHVLMLYHDREGATVFVDILAADLSSSSRLIPQGSQRLADS